MATVVTFLSPSPAASRRILQKIQRWTTAVAAANETTPFDCDLVLSNNSASDALTNSLIPSNNLLRFLIPRGTAMDSVALPLANDSILHFLSLHSSRNSDESDSAMKLFAIQSMSTTPGSELLQQVRDRLASLLVEHTEPTSSLKRLRILRSAITGRGITSAWGHRNPGLPILDLGESPTEHSDRNNSNNIDDATWNRTGALKEIVIPSYPTDTYPDGRSLFTALQQTTQIHRPMPGLYQLPHGLVCIRPLPSAKEDRRLPPPSLIFHTKSLKDNYNDEETASFRIGFTGLTGRGQIMLRCKHENWGLDVRMCPATKPSRMFSEAQESLLASSLKELQSAHVLSHRTGPCKTKDKTAKSREEDPNTNNTDCWVEFRANMKHPTGYIRRE